MVSVCPNCERSFTRERPMQRYCQIMCALWFRVDWRGKTNEECWNWTGSRKTGGYGGLTFQGVRYDVHRLAYTKIVSDPRDLFVCHTCDNPICCNPAHLFAGTPLDNSRDMDSKGRRKSVSGNVRGEKHYASKITAADVRAIRSAYSPGNGREIAMRYGLARTTVGDIVRRRVWKHVE